MVFDATGTKLAMRNLARSPRGWAFATLAAAGILTPFGWSWAASTRVGQGSIARTATPTTATPTAASPTAASPATTGRKATPAKGEGPQDLWSRITGVARKPAKSDPFLDEPAVARALTDPASKPGSEAKQPPVKKQPVTTDAARIARATPTTRPEPKPAAPSTRAVTPSRGASVSTRPAAGSSTGAAHRDSRTVSTSPPRPGRARVITDDTPSIDRTPTVASPRRPDTITRTSGDREVAKSPAKTSPPLDEALRLRAEQLLFRAKEAERQNRLTDALTLAEAAARIEARNPQLFTSSDSPTAYLEALEEHCRIAWDSQGKTPVVAATAAPPPRQLTAREKPATRSANAPREETVTASVARNRAQASDPKGSTEQAPLKSGTARVIPDDTPGQTVATNGRKTATPIRKPAAQVAHTAERPTTTRTTRVGASPIERTRGEQVASGAVASGPVVQDTVARSVKPASAPPRDAASDEDIPVTRRRLDPGLASNLARAGQAAAAHPTDAPKRRKPAIPERDGQEEPRTHRVASADLQMTPEDAIAHDARERDGSAAALSRAVVARSDANVSGRAHVAANSGSVTEPYRGPIIRPMTAARVDDPPASTPPAETPTPSVAALKPVPDVATLPAPGTSSPAIPVLTTPGSTSDSTPPAPPAVAPEVPPAAPPTIEVAAASTPALTAPPTLTPPTPTPEPTPPAIAAEPSPGPALANPAPAPETPAPSAPQSTEVATTVADAETSPRGWSLRQWRKFWIPIGGLAGGLTGLLGLLIWQTLERRAFASKRIAERRVG